MCTSIYLDDDFGLYAQASDIFQLGNVPNIFEGFVLGKVEVTEQKYHGTEAAHMFPPQQSHAKPPVFAWLGVG